jgi:hypothetical protein
MSENATKNNEEIFSKVLRAGRRTYFFDVRATKADDFYLTITESKKHEGGNGESYYKKHKVYLYKEDFDRFREIMNDMMDYIVDKKGEEVISERHNPDFKKDYFEESEAEISTETVKAESNNKNISSFTDLNFDEI